jgi:hypothetical protein
MKKVFSWLALGAVLAGCGLTPATGWGGNGLTSARKARPANAKPWTIIVHLAAENNLYPFGLEDLNEMEAGIDPSQVNLVVLFDGTRNGDSAVYTIERDPAGKNTTIVTKPNTAVPFIPPSREIDSGNVELVRTFGDWAIQNYPADHYGVIFWDHGSGIFRKGQGFQPTSFVSKGFGWDDNGSHMETSDLSKLVPAWSARAGKPLDIVAFDACLMGHVELAYQVKGAADYFVASEELVPGAGFDYKGFVSGIQSGVEPRQLASHMVDAFARSYQPGGSQNPGTRAVDYTMSAIDVNALTEKLVPALNDFSGALQESLPAGKATLLSARQATQTFYNRDCADIGHFAELAVKGQTSEAVKQRAQGVRRALASTVVREAHTGKATYTFGGVGQSQGLVIYFPTPNTGYNARYDDPSKIAYSRENWREFVKAFSQR